MSRSVIVLGLIVTLATFLALSGLSFATAGRASVPQHPDTESTPRDGDFNGDEFDDLVIGVPRDVVGSIVEAGAVNALYGSANGLSAAGNQLWHQDSPGIKDFAERGRFVGDVFGWALAAGNFNGDGFSDMAVGVPAEDVGTTELAGAVNVLYGSTSGLSAAGNQFWHQNSMDVTDAAEMFDSFGFALAAGNFDGDGFTDLAAGVGGEDVGDIEAAGAVNVLYGSANGLSAARNQFWHQNTPGIPEVAEADDVFSASLAAGDFDGDGLSDLAIGALGEDGGRGAVHVLYGSTGGLSAVGDQLWSQNSPGILDISEPGDRFGISLVAGDFNGDGVADLAVGASRESVADNVSAGAVNVLYGSSGQSGSRGGLTTAGNQFWHQNSPGIFEVAESGDEFGSTLATGDVNGDGFADLAIGVPFEDLRGISGAGAVNVLYGSPSGLSAAGNQFWHQNSSGIADVVEEVDTFGSSLAGGDLDGDGFEDLAIGVQGEGVDGKGDTGAVNVLYGSASGLSAAGNQFWHQNSPGIEGVAEVGDLFGHALAVASAQ